MKFLRLFYLLIFISTIIGCKTTAPVVISEKTTFEKLASIPNIVKIEKRAAVSHFDENYEVWFKQPVDYSAPSKGTFRQRVFLGFENSDKPVIVELRGYGIHSEKAGELANHYKANQLTIEHRYFNNSRPDSIDWNTLTIKNAAKDQALIIDAIRQALYPNSKFISTGISKGCQTTMAHRTFYPKNVDACVCYVGPLAFEREDPRIYEFLKNVGTKAERDKVKDFQELCFQNRLPLLELLKEAARKDNMSWEFGIEKALDYTILEYAFAYWQWGGDVNKIPPSSASVDNIYKHLIDIVGYSFFEASSVEAMEPYFWAALTEQGIYGYETAPFNNYFKTDDVYKFDWAFPDGISKPHSNATMLEIKSFLDTSAEKMLFIYGEYDTWSATAVELSEDASKREVYKYVKPKGDHKTRIKSFDTENQEEIYNIIDGWLETD